MRKILVLTVAIVCGFGLWMAACGDDDSAGTDTSETAGVSSTETTASSERRDTTTSSVSAEPDQTTTTSSTAEPVPSTIPVLSDYGLWEDTIKYRNADKEVDVNITVSIPEEFPDAGGMKAPADDTLVGIHVRIDNLGESDVEASPYWFTMTDADANVYKSITVTGADYESLEPGALKPGGTVEGYVFFEVPDGVMVVFVTCDASEGKDPNAPRTWSD